MAGEYVELPEDLIQHIQSFLDPKQAARTSVLSKLWYSAWSTRPVLSLDYYNFPRTYNFTELENFARTSINRYRKLNLKLNTFKLSMNWRYGDDYDAFTRLVDELILSALTLGVNHLYAYIPFSSYSLPDKVFSSICLKKLYFDGCNINLPQFNEKSRVLCSQLVSLELILVSVNDDMMRDILLGCPLMEDLRVINCFGLKKINLSAVRCTLRTIHVEKEIGKVLVEWVEKSAPGLQQQFHNLISLELRYVDVDDMFLKNFSHRFPCLERLELQNCTWTVTNTNIASNSLKYLTLIKINQSSVIKVQAPNIQNFRLVTEHIPSLSFLQTSDEWKSDLTFNEPDVSDDSWLLKIKDILRELSPSKISLKISFNGVGSHLSQSIPRISPFVENLEIENRRCLIWFDWLLFCQPKYITWIDWFSKKASYEVQALAYNELKKHQNKNLTDALPCIHGLEEVDMEHYDKTLREWCPVRQGTEEAAHGGGKFRLRLKWTKKRLRSTLQ